MGLRRFCCPWTPAGFFPTITWLGVPGGVCGRRSNGDILRLLFIVTPEFGSPELTLFLFWGPATNSSASSIIIPFTRKQTLKRGQILNRETSLSIDKTIYVDVFLPSYPAWKDSQMCASVWVGQGRSLSGEKASFLGTPDSFPFVPPGYCEDSLTTTEYLINT